MRLIFMGSPDFAVPSLLKLADSHQIAAIYSQPPRRSGRGMTEKLTPVAIAAQQLGLPIYWPISLSDPSVQQEIAGFNPDAIIVLAYGLLLPQAVLDIPKLGCINGHPSLLPRWRGAAPIQRAIASGDTQTGVTTMLMDAGLDTGPMLLQQITPIHSADTARSLHDRLAEMTAHCLSDTLEQLTASTLSSTPQSANGVTYAPKITTSETELDFSQTPAELCCQIRAFSPIPGCWLQGASGKRLKLLMAQPVSPEISANHISGIYLGLGDDGGLHISAGGEGAGGAISLSQLQPAGKKPMSARDFLNGQPLIAGTLLAQQV